VAVAATPRSAEPSATASLVVPVERINKFIIDDTVRRSAVRFILRFREPGAPRAI
jgi:hypothetical protein